MSKRDDSALRQTVFEDPQGGGRVDLSLRVPLDANTALIVTVTNGHLLVQKEMMVPVATVFKPGAKAKRRRR